MARPNLAFSPPLVAHFAGALREQAHAKADVRFHLHLGGDLQDMRQLLELLDNHE